MCVVAVGVLRALGLLLQSANGVRLVAFDGDLVACPKVSGPTVEHLDHELNGIRKGERHAGSRVGPIRSACLSVCTVISKAKRCTWRMRIRTTVRLASARVNSAIDGLVCVTVTGERTCRTGR